MIKKCNWVKFGFRACLGIFLSCALVVSNFAGTYRDGAVVSATGTGKNLQLVINGRANNILGAQGSYVYYGNYYQSNSTQREPIKWRVLDSDSFLILLSDKCLDSKPFHNTDDPTVRWMDSSLRTWIRTEFYHAFSNDEYECLLPENLGSDGGFDTWDKVFLLANNMITFSTYGFSSDPLEESSTRQAAATPYAISQGVGVSSNGYVNWWSIKSTNIADYQVRPVFNDGSIGPNAIPFNTATLGFRPVIQPNLDYVSLTSAAVGSKTSGAIGAGALTATSAYSGNEWKLTVLINDRQFAASRDGSGSIDPGDDITINYTDATVGTNEYISAILVNSSNEILYYGRIEDKSSGATSGTADITIPSGLASGDYRLMVYSEQYNGDKKTDLASPFSTINLTVNGTTPPQMQTPASQLPPSEDFYDDLRDLLDEAIAKGGAQTVYYSKGNALPYDIMKKLEDNPNITVVYTYSYMGTDYKATIAGKNVHSNIPIPWYGALYLNQYFGEWTLGSGMSARPGSQIGSGTYTVVEGDTLSRIAVKLGTTVAHLVSVNNIPNPDFIRIGQAIRY